MPLRETYINEVADFCGLDFQTIEELINSGLINSGNENDEFLTENDFELLHRVRRLQNHLGVNLAGIEVIVHMREQILYLQDELKRLKQFTPAQNISFKDME